MKKATIISDIKALIKEGKVVEATGTTVDEAKVKTLIASLKILRFQVF